MFSDKVILMNEEIINKINDVINLLDDNHNVKELKRLKKAMDNDEQINNLIVNFKLQKEKYEQEKVISEEFVSVKKDLYNHPLVNQYLFYEGRLSYFVLYFNQKMSSLTDFKSIKNPTCCKIQFKRKNII
jgi:cell fate (sporulation/competence/biofilm development) regulator YlbF (YheA/YmcA/DUF963 family)